MSEREESNIPTLTVSGGPHDGRVLKIARSSEVVLGSGANCHLRLEMANINSDHAYVNWDEQGINISDYGSSTGTYVNGEKIAENHPLADGDRLFLGPPGSKDSVKILVSIPAAALQAEAGEAEPQAEEESDALVFSPGGEEETPEEPLRFPPETEAGPPEQPLDLTPSEQPDMLDEPLVLVGPTTGRPAEAPSPSVRPPAAVPSAPAAPRPPPPAAPPPSAPPPALKMPEARRPARPDYTSEMPSIAAPDRVREPPPPSVPVAARPRPVAGTRRTGFPIPDLRRFAVIGGASALAGVLGLVVLHWLHAPPPVISGITPSKVEVGQAMSINGSGFKPDASKVVVRVGDQTAVVTSATDSTIVAEVPPVAVQGGIMDVPVTVENRVSKSNPIFLKVWAPPRVTALDPDVALPGDTVLAKGHNLKGDPMSVVVGNESATVESAEATAVRFRIPDLPRTIKNAPVTVRVGAEISKPMTLLIGRLPLVLEAAPTRAQVGERVVVRGRGFDAAPTGNSVAFGGTPALVLRSSETELTVAAPAVGVGSVTSAPVVVTVAGKSSASEVTVNIGRPATSFFVPRFFAAPTVPEHRGHEHAWVSSELGPFLLLTGKGPAANVSERAERVASALNAVFDLAIAGKPVALELRDRPVLGVALTGSDDLIVTATSADADGYSESWDPEVRPPRASAVEVTGFWKALIEDHLALFVQRQRPAKVLDLSARGKVLSDLYAEAARSGGNVSLSAVSSLSSTRRQAFRDMALLLAAGGQNARAGAAIEGRWQGTMVEGDAGERAFEVRFKVGASAKLEGNLTTRAGGLTMDIPLKEASYQKGTVRFAVPFRGTTKFFVGALSGDTLKGTIHDQPDARDAVGRFSLQYVQ